MKKLKLQTIKRGTWAMEYRENFLWRGISYDDTDKDLIDLLEVLNFE